MFLEQQISISKMIFEGCDTETGVMMLKNSCDHMNELHFNIY